jgi:hypothetical protein
MIPYFQDLLGRSAWDGADVRAQMATQGAGDCAFCQKMSDMCPESNLQTATVEITLLDEIFHAQDIVDTRVTNGKGKFMEATGAATAGQTVSIKLIA